MPIKGHWIKPAVSTYGPGCIVSVIVETEERRSRNVNTPNFESFRRCHVAESHRRSVLWSSPEYRSFDEPQGLFDWLEAIRSVRRKAYCFTPAVMDTLVLCDLFERWKARGVKLTEGQPLGSPSVDTVAPSVSPGPSDPPMTPVDSACTDRQYYVSSFIPGINAQIVKYRTCGRSYQWTSHSQYCQSHVDVIAKTIGYKWINRAEMYGALSSLDHSHMELAHMWLRFYQHLTDWWIDIDGGPWGPTVAAMSYSFLRKRLLPQTILRHNHARAGSLEDDAIFAGRRSVWYVGNIGSELKWSYYGSAAPKRSEHGTINRDIIHHDIRSMYPYLLSCMPYPTRLLEFRESISVADCTEALQTYGVIASVLLRTELPEYPFRRADGIMYPVGIFSTVLCGAELLRALNRGDVIRIAHAAIYELDYPFRESCAELLDMRLIAREQRQECWELFIKMLSNSMTGRLAMVPYVYAPRPDMVPLREWGQWDDRETSSKEIRTYKSYCGLTWERVKSELYTRPMGAAYAYLTTYGRWLMAGIRSICPHESVIAQDTDGIWCVDAASPYLYHDGVTDRELGGDIHWKLLSPVARFYGPQHYWHGHGWIVSGSNVLAIRPDRDTVLAKERHNMITTARDESQLGVYTRTIERSIGRINVPGDIDANGWVQPIRMHVSMADDTP